MRVIRCHDVSPTMDEMGTAASFVAENKNHPNGYVAYAKRALGRSGTGHLLIC